jgi:ABC-type phosphate transport system substrate-binding protein
VRLAAPVLAAILVVSSATPSRAADPFVVIVNPSVAGKAVHRQDLAAVFLKRAPRWGDRSPAQPVDQSGTSPVRQAFSESVLGMPVAAVLQYWQKAMFGTPPLRPPLVRTSDQQVVAFVAATSGAVGYVSAGATLPPAVKRLELID